ncbi:MAG: BlaI/MecI/CopY family transcriptional regulator [Chitinophagaceae bacterium]
MSLNIKPTESELEILKILWEKKECSVREVHTILASNKDVGYTTTLKLMQIMYDKGIVKRNDKQKTHLYAALIKQEDTQQQFVGKMVQTLFNGNASQLVLHTLGNGNHTTEELDAIQSLLNSLKHK